MKPRSSKDMGKTRVLPGPGDYSQAPCQLGGEVRIFTSQLMDFSRPIMNLVHHCFGGTKRVLNCRIMMNYVTSCFMRFDPAIYLRTRFI